MRVFKWKKLLQVISDVVSTKISSAASIINRLPINKLRVKMKQNNTPMLVLFSFFFFFSLHLAVKLQVVILITNNDNDDAQWESQTKVPKLLWLLQNMV